MLIIFMGPSSTGKSTVAELFKNNYDLTVFAGKDYLRLAKNELEAWKLFNEKLKGAASQKVISNQSIIYIVTEKNCIQKLKELQDAKYVKFNASFDTVKARFGKRMNGKLPKPVEQMLERQLSEWLEVEATLCVDSTNQEPQELYQQINDFLLNSIR